MPRAAITWLARAVNAVRPAAPRLHIDRARFTPVIDPGSLVKLQGKFSFAWSAPTNISYQVDYSTNLLTGWTPFTNIVTSTNSTFNFTDDGTNSGGSGNTKFYRLRTGS